MMTIRALIICLLFGNMIYGQTTGSFMLNVSFNEPDYTFNRNLYYHVPTDYDSSKAYKLVVGFRGGPHTNAGQFRDQLSFLSDSLDAIILCPENSAHFNNNEGLTKKLFKYSVDTTAKIYNIDTNFIYLTGLSYGGRHAVIVAMDTDNGPIPRLRGVIPFAAGTNSHLQPNYSSVSNFAPACICIGLNDSQNFIFVSNTLHSDIQSNGGASLKNEIPGVGHTVSFPTYPSEMMKCIDYIESVNSIGVNEPIDIDKYQIQLYPNPSNGHLQFRLPSHVNPTKISVVDDLGRTVVDLNKYRRSFSTSNMRPGIKTIIIESDEGVLTQRFMVTKN